MKIIIIIIIIINTHFIAPQYPKASGCFTDKNTCRIHTDNNEVKTHIKIHQKEENMIMHKTC